MPPFAFVKSFFHLKKHIAPLRLPLVTVLDIGSHKISCWILRKKTKESVEILGAGYQKSQGFNAGHITHMEQLQQAISRAVGEAENTSGEVVSPLIMSVNGDFIASSLMSVSVPLMQPTVTTHDINRLVEKARLEKNPQAWHMLHTFPLQYALDQQTNILNPRGMMGRVLHGCLHEVSGKPDPLRNVLLCARRCHLSVQALVVSSYASGLSCLKEDEQEMGAVLVEMGAGSTSLSFFWKGQLIHTDFLPQGGQQMTADLANNLDLSLADAERLKILYGAAVPSENDLREMIPVTQIGGDVCQIPRYSLVTTLQARLEETLRAVQKKIETSDFYHLSGHRIVFTGGASQIPGLCSLASDIMGVRTRIGKPVAFQGAQQEERLELSTLAGLVCYTRTPEYLHMCRTVDEDKKHQQSFWPQISSWWKENA